MAGVLAVARTTKYSPDQERDDHGRFAGGVYGGQIGNPSATRLFLDKHNVAVTSATKDRLSNEKYLEDARKNAVSWALQGHEKIKVLEESNAPASEREAVNRARMGAVVMADGYSAVQHTNHSWQTFEITDSASGRVAAAGFGDLYDVADGGKAFGLRYLGSVGAVPGAGSAIMAESMKFAAENNVEYRIIKPLEDAVDWYRAFGFEGDDRGLIMSADKVKDWVSKFNSAANKSIKYSEDQERDDHGRWTGGGSASLSTDQITTVKKYAIDEYHRINESLRNKEIEDAQVRAGFRPEVEQHIKNLDNAIASQVPTTSTTTVYRGITGDFIKDLKEGDVFTDKAFLSVSAEKNSAYQFAGMLDAFFNGEKATISITVPAGTKMLNVEDVLKSNDADWIEQGEQERLLARNTSLRIDRVGEPDFNHAREIEATLITSNKSIKYSEDQERDDHGRWTDGGGSGLGTKEDPFKTTNVEAAARALGEGKYVQLDSAEKVSTMLDKLNSMAKDATNGTKKVYDLCKVSVPGTNLFCVDSKGIPRVEMPQLKGVPTSGTPADSMARDVRGEVDITNKFVDSLANSGIGLQKDSVEASFLKATQNELNGEKVAGILQAARDGKLDMSSPLIVSRDNYIVDGHHRWAAQVALEYDAKNPQLDIPINVIRVDADIIDILNSAKSFSASMGIPQVAVKSIKYSEDQERDDHGRFASNGITSFESKPTEDQYSSLVSYTSGSGFINSRLRAGYKPEEISERVKHLDDLIASHSVNKDTVVYRGGNWSGLHFDHNVSIGQHLTDKAFLSTTTDGGYARTFMFMGQQSDEEKNFMMEIHIPQGSNALDVDSAEESYGKVNYLSEHEVLLPRDTVLEVTDVKEVPLFPMDSSQTKTVTRITANVISNTTSSKSLKYSEDQERDDHGRFAGGGLSSGAKPYDPKTDVPPKEGEKIGRIPIGPETAKQLAESTTTWRGIGTDGAVAALRDWQTGTSSKETPDGGLLETHRSWNQELAQGKSITELPKAAQTLDSLINQNVLRENTTLYRGSAYPIDISQAVAMDKYITGIMESNLDNGNSEPIQDIGKINIPGFAEIAPGAVMTDPGFLSTSRSQDSASEFAALRGGQLSSDNTVNVRWDISAPAGSNAIDLVGSGLDNLKISGGGPLSGTGNQEDEVVLPRDTHLTVNAVKYDSDNLLIIVEATASKDMPSKKSFKHLPGQHDQDDHGSWATGGSPEYKPGKWTTLDKFAVQNLDEKVISGVVDHLMKFPAFSRYGRSEVYRSIKKDYEKSRNKFVVLANGNVQIRLPAKPALSDEKIAAITATADRALSVAPKGMAGDNKFPIEISLGQLSGSTMGRWTVSRYGSADGGTGAAGGIVNVKGEVFKDLWDKTVDEAIATPGSGLEPKWLTEAGEKSGTNMFDYVVTHEIGHAVATYNSGAYDSSAYSAKMFRDAAESLGTLPTYYTGTSTISNYASDSLSERYAEHFAAYAFGQSDPLTDYLAKESNWQRGAKK
jgi:hypothetical protein